MVLLLTTPYLLTKSLKGGNRDFAKYELFRYEKNDFIEKQRVLKDGAFLVEFLPEENEDNMDYLYQIKMMAKRCWFLNITLKFNGQKELLLVIQVENQATVKMS